jgi:5'-deoxynucleotidase YfbR-like HD superfamily hydrolase
MKQITKEKLVELLLNATVTTESEKSESRFEQSENSFEDDALINKGWVWNILESKGMKFVYTNYYSYTKDEKNLCKFNDEIEDLFKCVEFEFCVFDDDNCELGIDEIDALVMEYSKIKLFDINKIN